MSKVSKDSQPVIATLHPDVILRYQEANEEVRQTLGLAPGPEFLMSLAVENQDPFELATVFMAEIVTNLREQSLSNQ